MISGFENDWVFSHFLGFIWIKSEVICEMFVKNAYHILIVHKMKPSGETVVKFWPSTKKELWICQFLLAAMKNMVFQEKYPYRGN